MADDLKKVRRGDPLRIPAATFNAFVDAAADFRKRQQGVSREAIPGVRQATIIPIRNGTGDDLDRFDVVGIATPIIDPADNGDEFKSRAMAVGVKPQVPTHRGRFAVMLEPVKDGAVAMGCVSGVIPCRINVDEESHQRADVEHEELKLLTGHHGSAEILWKEPGKGLKWAVLKIGLAVPLAVTFDVVLKQVEGYAGINCQQDCSYKYDLFDLHTAEKLNEDKDPQTPIRPRPAQTQMTAATRGTAYWTVKIVDSKPKIAVQLEEAFENPTPRKQQYVVTGISCGEGSSDSDGGADGGSDGCGCIETLTYHTAKVCYPPGTRIDPGPSYTVRCGSSSSGSSSGSGSPSDSGSPSGSPGSSSSGPGSTSSSTGSSASSSGSPGTPPTLPAPPTEPGCYQLCVCCDGSVQWRYVGPSDCGSCGSSSTPPPSSGSTPPSGSHPPPESESESSQSSSSGSGSGSQPSSGSQPPTGSSSNSASGSGSSSPSSSGSSATSIDTSFPSAGSSSATPGSPESSGTSGTPGSPGGSSSTASSTPVSSTSSAGPSGPGFTSGGSSAPSTPGSSSWT